MDWVKWKSWGGSGRRTRNRRSKPALDVSARSRSKTRVDVRAWARLIGIPLSMLLLLAMVVLGLRFMGSLLFSRNDTFVIRNLTIDTDDAVALNYLEGKRAIHKGANLFAFDIGDVREEFLRHSPNYKAITLTRVLPDTLSVAIVPRQPLAVIGRHSGFAVDAEGYVFGQRGAPQALPLLTGYQGAFLKPGERVQGLTSDAVRVLDTWLNADDNHEMPVRAIDVRGGFRGTRDALQVILDGDARVDLSWERGRGRITEVEDVRERILFLRAVMRAAQNQGRRIKEIDLTLEDYRHRNAVKYQ
ncbi:MAG: FtsQ-type POTRA domain-containing protein [Lentisphaerae bacterium]|nr:FtsQ-type POTRA domain-containing protein [Lentisphaerota bacterium]